MSRVPRFVPNLSQPRSHASSTVERVRSLDELTSMLVGADSIDGLSTDVFDTLVMRACGEPSDLYLWLGRRLVTTGLPVSAEVFARARTRAEAVVWHREGGMDAPVDLVAIYVEVVDALGLVEAPEDLAAAEFDLEQLVSRPVPGARELVKTAEGVPGLVLVATSDTYLRREQVADLLRRHGWDLDDRLLVSSDRSAAKASGRLFDHVHEVVGGDRDRILHVGDNPHADVDLPRALGLRAAWLPDARLNRWETRLSRSSFATAGLGAALAGASRQARLSTQVEDERLRAIRDVAAGVAAPVLVGYVLWVLERAVHHGLGRVAFLARDGQVLSALARRLVARLDLDVEVDYLAVSRQSTNLAATFGVTSEETGWVVRDAPFLTTPELLERFDLSWGDVRPHLSGSQPTTPPPTDEVVDEIRARLAEPGPLRELVVARAAERRALVTRYLDQEGLVGATPVGIVDFGGVGSQVRAVHELVARAGGTPPRIFLVGLDDPAQAGLEVPDTDPAWLGATETWLYDHRRGRGIRRERGFGTIVQMFCAADHGTVTGYRLAGDRIVADLAMERDEAVLAWGLEVLQDTVAAVADHLVVDPDLVDVTADLRDVVVRLVDLFWTSPTEAEAAAWGGFPFEGAQATSSTPRPLAHPYTLSEVVRGMVAGDFPNLGWQHWYEGSLRLSPRPLRTGLRVAESAFQALRRADGPIAERLVGWARARRP